MVGSNKNSWGWDLGRNKSLHNSESRPYPVLPTQSSSQEKTFLVPDTFHMILNMQEGTLAFLVEGRYLGVAHTGLKGNTLYPIVSAVWGHCEVTLKYRVGGEAGPAPLSHWCRRSIRKSVGVSRLAGGAADRLGLPNPIKEFILHR